MPQDPVKPLSPQGLHAAIAITYLCADEILRELIEQYSRHRDINTQLRRLDSLDDLSQQEESQHTAVLIVDIVSAEAKDEFLTILATKRYEGCEMLVFCTANEAEEWQELTLQNEITDYLIVRPLYDPGRMRIQIRHALERCSLRRLMTVTDARQAPSSWPPANSSPYAFFRKMAKGVSTGQDFSSTVSAADAMIETLELDSANIDERGRTALTGKRVLVIEDDPASATVVHDILHAEGFRVSLAGSHEEALEKHGADDFDLLLVDLMLPGISDADGIKSIKGHEPWAGAPIVVITARSDRETFDQCAALGISDYILKPIRRKTLLPKLASVLGLD